MATEALHAQPQRSERLSAQLEAVRSSASSEPRDPEKKAEAEERELVQSAS